MVKFVGFDRPAAFINICWLCCEGLLAFIPVRLLPTAIDLFSVIYNYTIEEKVAKQVVGSCRERDKSLEQANDAATVLQ